MGHIDRVVRGLRPCFFVCGLQRPYTRAAVTAAQTAARAELSFPGQNQ